MHNKTFFTPLARGKKRKKSAPVLLSSQSKIIAANFKDSA